MQIRFASLSLIIWRSRKNHVQTQRSRETNTSEESGGSASRGR